MEVVVLPGRAIGVQNRSYSARRVLRAIPTTTQCVRCELWALPWVPWVGRGYSPG